MKKLIPIYCLFAAATLSAQETQEIDPIAAEVFGDDMVAPDTPAPEIDVDAVPEAEPELPPAPTGDQTVPVADESEASAADEPEMTPGEAAEAEFAGVTLSPDATDEEELIYQYTRYRQLMNDRVFDEADSVAKRVVELAIRVKGPQSTELARALTNLAIVQHHTEQFDAAQQNFQSAIEIIEQNEDRLNEQLINPLKGLGASQLESGRPDLAGSTFGRAVHVTHVNDGPHNLEQIDILESLAEANLRMGAIDEARQIQDMIFSLVQREYSANSLDMVEPLMRRAAWQHRAGLIGDERTTLRRVVRIIETEVGKNDLMLIEPLTKLGKTFFYVDLTGTVYQQSAVTTGEIYFKRALRIATENPDADWKIVADTSLALADYYMLEGNEQRARKVYVETWELLDTDDERRAYRADNLETVSVLRQNAFRPFVSGPSVESVNNLGESMRQGNITIEYAVSARGRAVDLKVIEAQPAEFEEMLRGVGRELRTRVFRPRFVDGEPVMTEGQLAIHKFFYTQADLDALNPPEPAVEEEAT